MKLQKIQPAAMPAEQEFQFSDKTVQGARLGKKDNFLFVRSPRRYKLYADGVDTLLFLEGTGHIKWARGETAFCAGESIRVEGAGEYEVNGACAFVVRRG